MTSQRRKKELERGALVIDVRTYGLTKRCMAA
jgi:hypothetical protein